eukprot:452212-Prymnesium_polylepis.3
MCNKVAARSVATDCFIEHRAPPGDDHNSTLACACACAYLSQEPVCLLFRRHVIKKAGCPSLIFACKGLQLLAIKSLSAVDVFATESGCQNRCAQRLEQEPAL